MRSKLTLIFIFASLIQGFTQSYIPDHSVPVLKENNLLNNPWTGGLNAVHVNELDIDQDGTDDLLVYEKTTRSTLIFLREADGAFSYSQEHMDKIPPLNGWVLTRDFNGDGRKDIFTSHPLGIQLYINDLPNGFTSYGEGPILSKSGINNINIYVTEIDIPVIQDADGDGDLDIITFAFSGNTLQFHKNMASENNRNDTLIFERVGEEWGNVKFCSCNTIFTPDQDCPPEGRVSHAIGHALLLFDVDEDGDLDLIYSDDDCTGISVLENIQTNENPFYVSTSKEVISPKLYIPYPIPFLVDVDDDGNQDMVISTNSASINNYSVDYRQSIYWYEKTGSGPFSLVTGNFLQESMIDIGQNSESTFFDLDNDGDKDLLVGKLRSVENNNRTGFTYYENIGTYNNPEYQWVTDDLFSLSNLGFYNINLQFFDVTNDQRPDFVFSATSLLDPATRFYYFKNTGIVDFSSDLEIKGISLTIPFNGNYLIKDIYNDGTNDILVTYSSGVYRYELHEDDVILADENFLSLPSAIDALEIIDLDGDGSSDLLYSRFGELMVIYDLENNSEPFTLEIVNSDLVPLEKKLGNKLRVSSTNVLGNDLPEIVVGSNRGGLMILKNSEARALPEQDPLIVEPNPTFQENLKLTSRKNLYLVILSAEGKVLLGPVFLPSFEEYEILTQDFAAGMYIIHALVSESETWQKKFVVTK